MSKLKKMWNFLCVIFNYIDKIVHELSWVFAIITLGIYLFSGCEITNRDLLVSMLACLVLLYHKN